MPNPSENDYSLGQSVSLDQMPEAHTYG